MNRLYEWNKLDAALLPQALNNSNVTGRYYTMKLYRRALAVLSVGAMAATKTAKIEVYEATDASGSDAQLVTGASSTITANAGVAKATVALATVLAGDTVMINGVTYTAHASATTAANREFAINGNDTADAEALAGLINDATYGVAGVTAVASSGTITLTVDEPGELSLTISASSATFTIATVDAIAYVEIDADDLSDGYTHIAVKVTTTANTVVQTALFREPRNIPVVQYVGASAAI